MGSTMVVIVSNSCFEDSVELFRKSGAKRASAWTASPPGDGRYNRERVGGDYGSVLLGGEVAHVFIIQVQVNKSAHLALGGKKVLTQIGMRLGERLESFGDGGGVDLNGIAASSVEAQWRRDKDGHASGSSPQF